MATDTTGKCSPRGAPSVLGAGFKLNDWEREKVIRGDRVLELDLLLKHRLVSEVPDCAGYFYLNEPVEEVERILSEEKLSSLMEKHHIGNVDQEIKRLLARITKYNRIKDIAQTLMGKVATLREVSIKEMHIELGINPDESL